MQNVAILATSLNEDSRSQQLAGLLAEQLTTGGTDCELVDLRDHDLPLCGPQDSWNHPDLKHINQVIARASHVVLAVPIYNYGVNAAAKNLIELVGRAFTDKVIAFVCAAGGGNSYMGVLELANQLMLDFRAVIVPRFVYVTKADWSEDGSLAPGVQGRLALLGVDMARIHLNE